MQRQALDLKVHQKDLPDEGLFSQDVASLQADSMILNSRLGHPDAGIRCQKGTGALEQVFNFHMAKSSSFDVLLKQVRLFFPF